MTLEWLLFIVDVTDMSLQVGRYAKGPVTVFASKKKKKTKQVGRKPFVSSLTCKLCPRRHEIPSKISLSTQTQFLGPYCGKTFPELKKCVG